jgi:hypothetical protein
MSTRLCFLVVLVSTLQACTSRVNCESPESQAYIAALEASVGAKYADQYFTILNTPIDSCEAKARRAMYIEEFFEGYRAPLGTISGESSIQLRILQAGMRAGQEYRRAHPDSAAATYASYGYTRISTEGVWSTDFEHSGFVPMQGYDGEMWWAQPLPELARTLPDIPKQGLRMRINGYVSTKGQHGHLGAYERKVYVEQVDVLGAAQQGAAEDRQEDAASAKR